MPIVQFEPIQDEPEFYQGFNVSCEAQRTQNLSSTAWLHAWDADESLVFSFTFKVSDRFVRQSPSMTSEVAPPSLAAEMGRRWIHGLIDLAR